MRPLLATALTAGLIAACASSARQTPPIHAPAPAPEEAAAELPPSLRLPTDTRPTHYSLALHIDPNKPDFSGEVSIDVELTAARETLWLHAQGMTVHSATVEREGAEPMEATFESIDEDGLAALRLPAALDAGTARIIIRYEAPFGSKLRGLYKVKQGDDAYAFTQFEPLSAREAFPCFDEPRFKTPFDVRVVAPEGQTVIANTLQTGEQPAEAGVEHVYATTKPLPTYLLAWAVGPLEVVEAAPIAANDVRSQPLPFRGVAPRGKGKKLAYALERTPAMVKWLEEYFAAPYPYDKLDIIAVPDFSAGAMENAGAITFREVLLLMDEQSSQRQRRGFANVMAHELAHQWFGNLVTMPFWDDLWLNEAFATWMAARVVDDLYPDYHAGLTQLEYTHYAMGIDAKKSARAIRQPIEATHDIYNAFDGITYSKGGAVLAMFESYLGDEKFRAGLRAYMQKHAFGSATAEDLVAALSEAGGEPLKDAFFSFLTQPGVPSVDVKLSCEGDEARIALSQSRYVPLGGAAPKDARWQIPVCLRYEGDEEPTKECLWLREAEVEHTLSAKGCPSWVMPNAGAQGYYRWSLSSAGLDALADKAWPQLSDAERQSSVDNLAASLRAGASSPEEVYPVLLSMAQEGDRHVTATALSPLAFASEHLLENGGKQAYREALQKALRPRLKKLGMVATDTKEDGEKALLRKTLVSALCLEARDEKCRELYGRAGRAHLGMKVKRAPKLTEDLLAIAVTVAVQDGGEEVFEAALARLFESEDAMERSRMLKALGSVRDGALAQRARELSLDERLRVNEVLTPLWTQAGEPALREATWQWVLDHLDALEKRLPGRRAGQLVGLASGFCSADKAVSVRKQFDEHSDQLVGGPRELASAVESIELCAARARALRESAQRFFAAEG